MKINQCKHGIIILLLLLSSFMATAQSGPRTVKGTVKDDMGEPLAGVTVLIKGTAKGVSTDLDGKYSIEAKEGDVLVFSCIGLKKEEITLKDKFTINTVMVSDAELLDDVVVIGYGVQTKRDLTGTIGSVSAEAFSKENITDINQTLMGKIAGVNVMNSSGTPGGGLDIQIRGISSISSSTTPLYVIDDVPIQVGNDTDSNPLSYISPADIKSVDVLKDAAAAAIYGSRASNGVVIITTKSGSSGAPVINFSTKVGIQQLYHKIEMLSAEDFALLSIEARNNSWVDQGKPIESGDDARGTALRTGYFEDFLASGEKGTDWQKEIYQVAPLQEYQLSLTGGNNVVKYMSSANITSQKGILKNTGFSRYSFRTNLDIKANDRLKFSIKMNPVYTNQDFLRATGRWHDADGGIVQAALIENPLLPVYDENSVSGYAIGINQPGGIVNCENPRARVDLLKDTRYVFSFIGNLSAIYNITDALSFKLGASTNVSARRNYAIVPSILGSYSAVPPQDNTIKTTGNNFFNIQGLAQLTYHKVFNEKNKLNGVLVYEVQKQQDHSLSATAKGTWTDDFIIVDSNLSDYLRSGASSISEWALMSVVSRFNYDYDGKYLISGSLRADGSSRFAQRWGFFPSVAGVWRMSRERFMRNVYWLSDLKFKLSYGKTGNNSIGNYAYKSLMGGSSYALGKGGETILSGLKLNSFGNEDLTWEKTDQWDFGFDFGLFNNRVHVETDLYDKYTYDLLLSVNTPANLGFGSIMSNIGRVENRGAELTLTTKNFVRTFKWSTDFNISLNRQRVLELGPEGDPLRGSSVYFQNTHITEVGQPMGRFYGLNIIGIFQNQEQVDSMPIVGRGTAACSRPGQFMYEDVFEDYKIDANDRTIIGDPHPDFTFGFTNEFSYKNLSLSILMRGSVGAEILNFNYGSNKYMMSTNQPASFLKNRWISEDQPGDGKTPRLTRTNKATVGSEILDSSFVEDATFLNIQNVNLSYTVPAKRLKKCLFKSLKASLSIQNLHMFTNYQGYNPESGLNIGSTLAPGVDWGCYPLASTVTLGINVTL